MTEKPYDIESIGNPEDPEKFEITDTKTNKVYTINANALKGGDYHKIIQASDGTISDENLKKYYERLLLIIEGGDDNTFMDELWEEVNPGCKLIECYISSYNKGEGKIKPVAEVGDTYITMVNLTPDWQPEDGGTLELWTPNLNDEMKAMAVNTPYGLNGIPDINIVKSYWPRTGRVITFDARIPYIQRSVDSDKESVSVVFQSKKLPN